MRESQSVSPSVREPVPVRMLCGPGGVLSRSPSLPRPSPYAQICMLLCLDETGISPHNVEGVVHGLVGLRSRSDRCILYGLNPYYACLYMRPPKNYIGLGNGDTSYCIRAHLELRRPSVSP
jgi:hypothetical protein